jgi:glucokinase
VSSVIAIDIGGTNFRVGLFSGDGTCRSIHEEPTSHEGGREWMLERLAEQCAALRAGAGSPVTACGISFGGPVNHARQLATSVHSPGWNAFPLAQWVRDNLQLRCEVENDANAGAIGEFRFGAGRGCQSIVYITLSTGVGSGVILDGKVLRGKDGMAGEFGHLPLSDSGVMCSCGARGCLETLCSGTAIARAGRERACRVPEKAKRLVELSGGEAGKISAKSVLQAAAEGDPMATEILRETTQWLARGLLTLIRILNPDKIILGGGVALAGSVLLRPLSAHLEQLGSPIIGYSTQIVMAELGVNSALYGAAAIGLAIPQDDRQ